MKHVDTKAYRPQTIGTVERFNRTLKQESAHIRPCSTEKARQQTHAEFIHDYNDHRSHTVIDGLTPAQRVHNVTGKYI
ncbi:integrase core domain-containing protein [Corynebacterium timonense]|uniref:integrase core domain-containing protein n=1 Tax=Corynebacterium timonense TaxID=441500 RepID=UPI0038B26DDE